MSRYYKLIYVLIICIGSIGLVYAISTRYSQVVLGGKTFNVDVVTSNYALQKGLSGKKLISNDYGMLFVFPVSGTYGIWMKDMHFPIDIIWINENKEIVMIEKNVSPNTYPKIFTSQTKARYVLEISAGQIDLLSVKIGDFVEIKK